MGWLRLVGRLKLHVSFAKEPYERDNILQKRPIIVRSLLIGAIPYFLCQNQHRFSKKEKEQMLFQQMALLLSDTSSIEHLVMREFASGPPRYHLAIKGVRDGACLSKQSRWCCFDIWWGETNRQGDVTAEV